MMAPPQTPPGLDPRPASGLGSYERAELVEDVLHEVAERLREAAVEMGVDVEG